MPKISMDPVLQQAARYGAQVALLDNQKMEKERTNIRIAYFAFRGQFEPHIHQDITDAYWNAYDKHYSMR